MTTSKYIPAGRTSKVERRQASLQVQTEYAGRPIPRITTTILNAGKVVHKIERNLDKPIESLEEQARVELSIKSQHAEIIEIIKNESGVAIGQAEGPARIRGHSLTVYDRLLGIPGVQCVYRLDNEGGIVGEKSAEQFRRTFGTLFKNLRELVEIFVRIPSTDDRREQGVYEIEPDHLYLVSADSECYFVVVSPAGESTGYEQALRKAIPGDTAFGQTASGTGSP